MKRSWILLLTAIICVASFIMPVAADSTDSLHLNSEEESQLDVSSDDTVVKLFCGSFMKDFSAQKDITNIVEKSEIMYLIVKSNKINNKNSIFINILIGLIAAIGYKIRAVCIFLLISYFVYFFNILF